MSACCPAWPLLSVPFPNCPLCPVLLVVAAPLPANVTSVNCSVTIRAVREDPSWVPEGLEVTVPPGGVLGTTATTAEKGRHPMTFLHKPTDLCSILQ